MAETRSRDWVGNCPRCPTDHWPVNRLEGHRRVTEMIHSMGYECRCGKHVYRLEEWHDHILGLDRA